MQDRITKIDEQISKLKAQKQSILNREKARERKERTHRLIQIGAIIEKYFGIHSPEEAEALGMISVTNMEKFREISEAIAEKVAQIKAERKEGDKNAVKAGDTEKTN